MCYIYIYLINFFWLNLKITKEQIFKQINSFRVFGLHFHLAAYLFNFIHIHVIKQHHHHYLMVIQSHQEVTLGRGDVM